MSEPDSVHQKESDFHDQWAENTPLENIAVREAFEAPTAMENKFILERIGSLRGLKLLDVGTGLGESAVYFAMQGAQVTAADLSAGMIERALELAKFHGTKIEGVVCPAEKLAVGDSQFDIVYVGNTLHHATDKRAVFAEMRRVLKPGGRFFSIDPLAYNPVISVYRRMATHVRTIDEKPLNFADLKTVQEYFTNVGHREFWIASLALFLKFYLLDRVHPNADRYWKRIYRPQSLGWWKPLREIDWVLTRIPLVRRLAWNMVMWGTKKS
jgi:ubiquinone/menaquinone biosynthesis C-methylase UbiE